MKLNIKSYMAKSHIFLFILPYIVAVSSAILYLSNLCKSLHLIAINILFVPLIALEFTIAFVNNSYSHKLSGFIAAGAITGIASALNIHNDTGVEFSIRQLTFWSWLWVGLLLVCIVSTLIMLTHMINWDQNQWEEIRKSRQEYRKKLKDTKHTRKLSKQTYKRDLLEKKNKRRLENSNSLLERVKAIAAHAKTLGAVIVALAIVGLFLCIPISGSLQDIVFDWFDAIKKLSLEININYFSNGKSDQNDFLSLFASYLITYILLIVAIFLISFLCRYIYQCLKHKSSDDETPEVGDNKHLLEKYDTPIAILTVFVSFLFAIGKSEFHFEEINSTGALVFAITSYILIVFVAVEIVRLIVEQIGQTNSLLKRLIQLIFVTIIEFIADLLLGIVTSFQLERVVSSVLSVMFPQEKKSSASKVRNKLQSLFNGAIDDISGDDLIQNFPQHHKIIWKRGIKK